MTEEELRIEKKKLVEELGVYIEKKDQLAPVAARILATLILTCKQGVTFEQLVTDLEASKSTVSSHLNTLQASGSINYCTKPGDRKRYFILTPDRLLQFIDEKLEMWEKDKKMHHEVIEYKNKVNELYKNNPENQCDITFSTNFLTFLDEATAAFSKLKTNLCKKNQTPITIDNRQIP